jgi:hypothetical protein
MIVNCKTASALISESMEKPLTPVQKLKVYIHLFLCRYVGGQDCAKYQAQIDFLHQAASRMPQPKNVQLTPADKKRLQKAIQGSLKKTQKAKP